MAPRNETGQPPYQHQFLRPVPAPRLFSRLSHASKQSFRSHSSSFEADDEHSSGDGDDDDEEDDSSFSMSSSLNGNGRGHGSSPPARYPGEDTRPTSRKELAGWYAYAFAAETYVICGIGSFIPILLESLARQNGVLLSDHTTPCGPSSDKSSDESTQCVVYVLGMEINTASFAMYTFSISVLLQALLVVSISCAADHGNYRKKLLLTFGWFGSFCVMAYIFITKETYVLGAVLAILSNTSFGASFVLLNSFLPLVVRHHPRVEQAAPLVASDLAAGNADAQSLDASEFEVDIESTVIGSTEALLPGETLPAGHRLSKLKTHEDLTSLELELSTEISAKGIGIGYMAGLFVQCAAIGILVKMHSSIWSLRVVLLFIGGWWALFTIPAAMWLRPRPGPPLTSAATGKGAWALVAYTAYAWLSLWRTIKLARRLVDIMLFLGGWFLLSDAIATTSSTAILFAKTQLRMEPWALGMINVISTTAGVVGAFSWSFISRRAGLRPHQTILVCIAIFEVIPLYGLAGYLPFVQGWGVGGLQQPWEMFPLAAIFGFVLGGLSGYCRSLYGELIPPGSEAAFYALYAITDKGSSVFGPAIVGAIIDKSGEIRPAFWFLAALVGFPACFIWFVNVDRGKREGEKLAEIIEGYKVRQRDEEAAAAAAANGGSRGDSEEGNDESRGILAAYEEDERRNQ